MRGFEAPPGFPDTDLNRAQSRGKPSGIACPASMQACLQVGGRKCACTSILRAGRVGSLIGRSAGRRSGSG